MIDFRLKDIEITGFRSFKHTAKFALDREPGLYFISGKNVTEPRLGANGCGKSSIWDAVSWALFGKTVRGIRGDNIINWDSKSAKVDLNIVKDGTELQVVRKQNPNDLTLNGIVLTQSDLEKELGIDHEKFIYAAIIGQFNATFLDLKPSDKLAVFSDIMSLDFWEKRSKRATDLVTTYENTRDVLQEKWKGIETQLEALRGQETDLKAKEDGFEKGRGEEVKTLTVQLNDHLKKLGTLESEQSMLKEEIDRISEDLKPLVHEEAFYESCKKLSVTAIQVMSEAKARTTSDKNRLQREFDKWKSLADVCPYCTQHVDKDLVKEHQRKITKEFLTCTKDLKKIETEVEESKKSLLDDEQKIRDLQAEQGKLNVSYRELNKKISSIENDLSLVGLKIRTSHEAIEKVNTGTNPYTELVKKCQAQIDEAHTKLESSNKEIEDTNKLIDGTSFWTKGFKDLRLWVISDALVALEIESNNAASKLGLMDWKLKFQMERETTKGSISRGFHVLVNSKTFKDSAYIPLEVWSGGETQRLRLSAVKGMSSLIQNYKGISINVSVWDEPSSYLSEQGIEDLIRYLSEEAVEQGKVIYFVDHRNLESSYFKSVINVVKTEEGTSITENDSSRPN